MKKIFYILIFTLLCSSYNHVIAQCNGSAPIINSFSPNTGFIGSTVTIIGANFDPIPASNQVFFGATQATVLTASFGVLTVKVPVGATTAPISVKNGCNLSAYSKVSFNGIFCPTPVNANTYNNVAFTVTGGYGAYNMLSQDMDLDGKPDIVLEGFGSGFTIARNTSTVGNISFVANNFAVSGRSVAVADFDGDGKRDVLTAGDNGIFIMKNSSVPGTISFSSTVIVKNGGGWYQCATGDFNNDGKIDFCAEFNGSTMNVFLNTSTGPGNISFTQVYTQVVNGRCTGIQCADVDGDGKTDILATQGGNNRAISMRNTTTPGSSTISFEPYEAWSSNGTYPYRCQVADFDKDGKIDLTTCNYQGTTNTAIFRNTSTVGDISFASAFTMPAPTANYRIQVGDVNGDGLPDVVTKSLGANVFSVYPNTSSGPGNISFGARIDYSSSATAEVSGIVIGDLDGDNVPDIATSGINSGTIRVHRNTSAQLDVTPPTAACKNIIVALSPSGNVTVTASMIDNGSSDACGIGSIQINNSPSVTFTCANIGDNIVTLKVTDRAGNVSTCTATVTVAPAAIIVTGQTTVCQGQTVLLNANLGDSYQWQRDGVDISGATNQTYTATVSGNYTVTVTNAGGCSGTSAPTVITVNNNPTVNTVPSGLASLCPPGNLAITASTSSIYQWKLNGNNISGATQQSYNATGAGSYSVQVVDLFGCSATSAAVVVNATDNIPPTAVCKNVTVAIDANGTAGITVASINNGSFDNCTVASVAITAGKTSYTCSDAGQTFPVTLTVIDGSGNSSSCTAQVSVTDPNSVCNHPPVAVCKAVTVFADANCNGTAVATAFDGGSTDVDAGDILTFSILPAGPYAVGTTNVTLTVTDSKGASSSCTTTITVVDNTPPVISGCPGDISVATGAGSTSCGQVATWTAPTATDNCGTVTVTSNYNPGDVFAVGTTLITYTFTDSHSNTSSCSFNVTVTDNTPPVISGCPGDVSVTTGAGRTSCDQVATWTAPTASDNCGSVTVTSNYNTGNVFPVGTTPVTYTFTDSHGNTSSCSFNVTVVDNTPPVASCKPVLVTLVNGAASITVADVNNNSSDNCGITSTTISKSSFNCSNIGANYVTLTVTDIHGNVSTCTATVTVVGEIPTCSITSIPTSTVFTGGNPKNLYLGYGAQSTTLKVTPASNGAPYTYSWSGPAGLSSTTSDAPVFTPTVAGQYTFTVTTTNKYGCVNSCSITICVSDIRVAGTNGSKVYVCHLPPGNPGNPQTLSISVNAVPAHLGNHTGDRLGSCDMAPCGSVVAAKNSIDNTSLSVSKESVTEPQEELKVTVIPNPSTTFFTLKLESKLDIPISLKVSDANGRLIDAKSNIKANSTIQVGQTYISGTYYAEMIQGAQRKVVQLIKVK